MNPSRFAHYSPQNSADELRVRTIDPHNWGVFYEGRQVTSGGIYYCFQWVATVRKIQVATLCSRD